METVTQSSEKLSEKRRVHIKQVDAFADKPLTGNPAGVVLDAEGLSDRDMMTIAREMSVPETAFILPASTAHADLRIRWFTSTVEVPLCGHATIAGFHALAFETLGFDQHHVRRGLADRALRFGNAAHAAHDFQLRHDAQPGSQCVAHAWVSVDDQDANAIHGDLTTQPGFNSSSGRQNQTIHFPPLIVVSIVWEG